jgi:hypothetical protein
MKNQVLQILIPNEATGYKVIQLAGWTGKCFLLPRTELKEIGKRAEIKDPGVYFLFGENDDSTGQKLYIGESERFFDRLLNHDANKDFWNSAFIFTGGLDKAKVKHLEYLAIVEAKKAQRYDLLNNVSPKENALSEFDVVITQEYFSKIDYLLTALGYPVFKSVKESLSDRAIYTLETESTHAQSQLLEDGSLNVLKGSLARIKNTNSLMGWSLSARKKFLEDGTFKDNGDGQSYVLTKNVLFKSPSSAAGTMTGGSINGWTAWKDKNGRTLDENLRGN